MEAVKYTYQKTGKSGGLEYTDNMKNLLLAIGMILLLIAVYILSDYPGRMKEYNAHMCATNGYEPDCKTKLK